MSSVGVFDLYESNAARRYPNGPPLGIGEPAQATFCDRTFHLAFELLGVVNLDLEELVGRADPNANFHACDRNPLPSPVSAPYVRFMVRIVLLIAFTSLFLAGGTAGADDSSAVRLPVGGAATSAGSPDSVVVRQGDHLWKISARALGRDSSDSAVAPYWVEVVDVNRPRLRSGDPDLIYPGEMILLPSFSEMP